jgi:alkylation response protein AidB-like acyl-CoA dehydrogenase
MRIMADDVAPDPARVLARAGVLAAEVLAPAAMAVETSQRVPPGHLDLLAAEGFYGLAGPREAGGLDLPFHTACQVIETLAGACLSTTFVWTQHHGVVRAVAGSGTGGLRAELLGPLCRGERRAGVALGGTLPGPTRLRARAVPGGYRLDGTSPWVTGWGLADTLYVAARDEQDTIVWGVLDVPAGEAVQSLSAEPVQMVAVMASRTVQLRFDQHFMPASRVASTLPLAEWQLRDAAGLRVNGSLALGLAARCCQLIGPGPLDDQLTACRAELDTADPDTLPTARAAACELAMRAAAALVVSQGATAILADQDAQRLAREALFLLVFGSRPAIKRALGGLLAGAGQQLEGVAWRNRLSCATPAPPSSPRSVSCGWPPTRRAASCPTPPTTARHCAPWARTGPGRSSPRWPTASCSARSCCSCRPTPGRWSVTRTRLRSGRWRSRRRPRAAG